MSDPRSVSAETIDRAWHLIKTGQSPSVWAAARAVGVNKETLRR